MTTTTAAEVAKTWKLVAVGLRWIRREAHIRFAIHLPFTVVILLAAISTASEDKLLLEWAGEVTPLPSPRLPLAPSASPRASREARGERGIHVT